MTKRPNLLAIDDDAQFLRSLKRVLSQDYDVTTAQSPQDALRLVRSAPNLVLLDIRFKDEDENDRQGIELLQAIRRHFSNVPVIVMTAYADVDIAVEAMRLGASDFVQKGRIADVRELKKLVGGVLERASLSRRVVQLEQDLERLEPWEIIGETPQIQEVKRLIDTVAEDGYVTVLLRGETGTGKELAGRAIWRRGWRATAPFVPVALASLNPNIIESELFGHEPGAFTDAKQRRVGYIERANGGVLFLDEIGDLPGENQVKLLRFLEERIIRRMGSTDPIPVDVQVVTATNKELEIAVQKGEYRQDLYFRLKAFQIILPTLRERRADISLLADHFLNLFRQQGRTRITTIEPKAMERLQSFSWSGNVRELRSTLEWGIMLANRNGHHQIEEPDLPLELLSTQVTRDTHQVEIGEHGVGLEEALARAELAYVESALRRSRGKKTEAWKLLGLNDRFALRRRVKRILDRYPEFDVLFPLVHELYGGKGEAAFE